MVQRYYTGTPIVNTLQPTGDEAETEPPIAFFRPSVSSRWSLSFHSPTAESACAPCGDYNKSLQASYAMLAGIGYRVRGDFLYWGFAAPLDICKLAERHNGKSKNLLIIRHRMLMLEKQST